MDMLISQRSFGSFGRRDLSRDNIALRDKCRSRMRKLPVVLGRERPCLQRTGGGV